MRTRIIEGDPIRIVEPAALPLTLAELRAQARLDGTDGTDVDPLLLAYLRAAVNYVEVHTGLGLITQTWQQSWSAFGGEMLLRRRPLQAVLSVEYLDADDVSQTVETSVYRVSGAGGDKVPARIRVGASQSWPTTYDDAGAVTVTYRVGYGDDHNDVPELIRHAIMMLVAYWADQRSTALIDPIIVEVPFGTRELLRDWRPLAIA